MFTSRTYNSFQSGNDWLNHLCNYHWSAWYLISAVLESHLGSIFIYHLTSTTIYLSDKKWVWSLVSTHVQKSDTLIACSIINHKYPVVRLTLWSPNTIIWQNANCWSEPENNLSGSDEFNYKFTKTNLSKKLWICNINYWYDSQGLKQSGLANMAACYWL
jgi:hypothetical protein